MIIGMPGGFAQRRQGRKAERDRRQLGEAAAYVRQVGFDSIQQEEMVKTFVSQHGSIRRRDVIELCRLSPNQATRLLLRLVEKEILRRHGQHKSAYYERV